MGKKSEFHQIFDFLHNRIQNINGSKVFAGFMIVSLNIVSKFVNIKMSKTMESYLKVSFSKYLLIFIIAWMGTRDIYIAFTVMILYSFVIDYLLNEDSVLCILPNSFKDNQLILLENFENKDTCDCNKAPDNITTADIKRAQNILAKAKLEQKI